MSKRSGIHPVARRATRGFSLIEMMIAMVLGLLVVGAAIGIFVSNQQAYRATEGLGRVQARQQHADAGPAGSGPRPAGHHFRLMVVFTPCEVVLSSNQRAVTVLVCV